MPDNIKVTTAIGILKTKLPELRGRFRGCVSERNANAVDIFSIEEGYYCTVNIRSGAILGI